MKMLLLRRLASVAAVSGGIFGRINAAQGPGVTHATSQESLLFVNVCFMSKFTRLPSRAVMNEHQDVFGSAPEPCRVQWRGTVHWHYILD